MDLHADGLSLDAIRGWSFSEVAKEVARRSRAGEADALRAFLVSNLLALGTAQTFDSNSPEVHTHFRLGLGLGVLTAAQESGEGQQKMCESTFGQLIFECEGKIDRRSKLLLLTELCYLDQFVLGETRQYINSRFGDELRRNAWSPAIRDYLHAWGQLEQFKRFQKIKTTEAHETPRLILVMSAKGGTGKSITAAAIAKYLIERGKKVGLIDLDDSGPTAQYLFDVAEVSETMGEIPPGKWNAEYLWCYPTFLDVLNVTKRSSSYTEADFLEAARKVILECQQEPMLSLVLLPESPTFCSEVARAWGGGEPADIIRSVSACVQALASDRGCEYVIIDFAPGLYGTNGAIIKWASTAYPTTPVVLTSSRASDIATSIYEAPWLAAKYEFSWKTPLLHFVNRWHYKERCVDKIVAWAEQATGAALDLAIGRTVKVSSATEIHSKRFWPIMYQVALDKDKARDVALFDATHVLAQLPEDPVLREIASLHSDPKRNADFAVGTNVLEGTQWYAKLRGLLDQYLYVEAG